MKHSAHPHENPHHPHWPLAGLLFIFVFLLGRFSVHETATWVHIKTGEHILRAGAVAKTDPFSYSVAEKPWATVSWLSDVLFYRLDASFGPDGPIVLKSIVGALAFALLLPLSPGSPIMAAAVLSLGALAVWPGFTETPAIFDWLLAVLFIRLLRPRKKFHWRAVPIAAGLELLWANLHGPWAAVGLWFIFLKMVKTAHHAGHKDRSERYGYPIMLGACALAFFVNPLGIEMVGRLFAPSLSSLPYWQLAPAGLFGPFIAAGLAAAWICLQQEFFLSLAAAGLIAFSLLFPSLRPLAVLCGAPVITLALGHFIHPWGDTLVRAARLAMFMGALFFAHYGLHYQALARSRGYGAANLSGAAHFLKANGVVGRMFNAPESGDALIGEAERPVFVDGRAGLYGESFMADAASWSKHWGQLDEVYNFDYAVILNRRADYPARALDAEPWRLAYADDEALVYVKKSGADAWLVSGSSRGDIEPNRLWPDALDAALADKRRAAKILDQLDRWIVQSPDSIEALLWKAYALDQLKLAEKAERLVVLAQSQRRLAADPELTALLGFVLERRGERPRAQKAYRAVAQKARRLGDHALESAVLARLGPLARDAGQEWEARGFEERIKELAAVGDAE